MPNLIFIHGYESSGSGFKGRLLKTKFPTILTPNFTGNLEERMKSLLLILNQREVWTIIGSSFGGLMATMYANRFPQKVERLILLAPAIIPPFFSELPEINHITIPTLVIQGINDNVVKMNEIIPNIQSIFRKLELRLVEDDHLLHHTVNQMNWEKVIPLKSI